MNSSMTLEWAKVRAYLASGMLIVSSLAVMTWVAVKGSSDEPMDPGTAAVLTILAGLFQLLGAASAARASKVDPGHARGAVTRLARIGLRAQRAEEIANVARESRNLVECREALGQISLLLSYVQEDAGDMVSDWKHFHPHTVQGILLTAHVESQRARIAEKMS
jgi:hypothetical protein